MVTQATDSDWPTTTSSTTTRDGEASTNLHGSDFTMAQQSADAAITPQQQDHDISTRMRAENSTDPTVKEEQQLAFAAYDANEERHIKDHVTVRRKVSALPSEMSTPDAEALAAAQTRRWARMQAAEADYQTEVGKIGRKVTGFLDLSPELRNIVYGYAFVFPNNKCLMHVRFAMSRGEEDEIKILGDFKPAVTILATCKQINEEGSAVLYGANKFDCDLSGGQLGYFVESIGRNIQHIREVEFEGHIGLKRLLEAFREATTLNKFNISLELWDNERAVLFAARAFVLTQFKKRKAEGRDRDKLLRRSKKVSMGRRETCKLSDHEQALATLDILKIEVPIPTYKKGWTDVRKEEDRLRRKPLIDDMLSRVYDGLARMVGLIGRTETLEETGAYDWRAARERGADQA